MKHKFGFTTIELLVVISIISLISSVSSVSVNEARKKAIYARTVADLNSIAKAALLYFDKYGSYPADTWIGEPSDLKEFLPGQAWPTGAYKGSYYDWDYWTDAPTWTNPSPPGTIIAQVSLRFCSDVDSEDCQFPNEPWAVGFTNRSSVYYCIEGPCRSHKNLPIGAPGKKVN